MKNSPDTKLPQRSPAYSFPTGADWLDGWKRGVRSLWPTFLDTADSHITFSKAKKRGKMRPHKCSFRFKVPLERLTIPTTALASVLKS